MPFKETCPVEERISMLREYDTGLFTVTELARRFHVSRDTFNFWRGRRASGDPRWYEARAHAVRNCPHQAPSRIVADVIAMRDRYPYFGPKKIKDKLAVDRPAIDWPAASTIGDILRRNGRIASRPNRRKALDLGETIAGYETANGEWSIDFKGWFRTLDGTRCDPLTIVDTASRFLIEVRITDPTWAGVRGAMERMFKGLRAAPEAIRSDNGAPFGSIGAGGQSSLSVWWLKLGIEPCNIPPASSQHNVHHKPMHRTLKAETSRPAAANLKAQ